MFYEFWWGLLAAAWILVLGATTPGLLLGGGRCITRQHMHAQISTTRSDRNVAVVGQVDPLAAWVGARCIPPKPAKGCESMPPSGG